MIDKKVHRTCFLFSLSLHLLLLSMPGFNLAAPPAQKPEDISIVLRMEIPPLLPEIKVMGEEKKLKEEELPDPEPEPEPEPEPQPEPKPEPEPEPEEIVIEEPLPEPEPIVEPAPEPRPEIVEVIDPREEAMLRYQDMVKQQIESRRRYPYWAKRQGFEGTVYLSFIVLANGQAKDIRIIRPSGFTILDNEAVSTVKKASPFPPIPKKLNSFNLDIEVAIVFILNPVRGRMTNRTAHE